MSNNTVMNLVKRVIKDRYNDLKNDLLKVGTILSIELYGSFNNPRAYIHNENTDKNLEVYLPVGYLYGFDPQNFMDNIDCYKDNNIYYVKVTKQLIKESK